MQRIFVAVVVVILSVSLHARRSEASVIQVTNLANAQAGATATLNFTESRRAGAFTTDASAASWTLSSITARLQGPLQNADSVAQMSLFSDNSGLPGTLLETLNGSPTPAGAGDFTFTSAGTTLSSNTTYWIIVSKTSGTTLLEWLLTSDFSQTSPDAWTIADLFRFSENSGATWGGNSSFAPLFNVAVVPEPASALMLLAMTGLALVRRRPL